MLSTSEPTYNYGKPPILLIQKTEKFVCAICTKTGWGPPNSRVHQGRCRTELTRQNAKRTALRNKHHKETAHALASAVAEAMCSCEATG